MRAARLLLLLPLATPVTTLAAQDARLDSLDVFIDRQMALRDIPGLSLAIVENGRILASRAYGV